jgi:hypothetical protein
MGRLITGASKVCRIAFFGPVEGRTLTAWLGAHKVNSEI